MAFVLDPSPRKASRLSNSRLSGIGVKGRRTGWRAGNDVRRDSDGFANVDAFFDSDDERDVVVRGGGGKQSLLAVDLSSPARTPQEQRDPQQQQQQQQTFTGHVGLTPRTASAHKNGRAALSRFGSAGQLDFGTAASTPADESGFRAPMPVSPGTLERKKQKRLLRKQREEQEAESAAAAAAHKKAARRRSATSPAASLRKHQKAVLARKLQRESPRDPYIDGFSSDEEAHDDTDDASEPRHRGGALRRKEKVRSSGARQRKRKQVQRDDEESSASSDAEDSFDRLEKQAKRARGSRKAASRRDARARGGRSIDLDQYDRRVLATPGSEAGDSDPDAPFEVDGDSDSESIESVYSFAGSAAPTPEQSLRPGQLDFTPLVSSGGLKRRPGRYRSKRQRVEPLKHWRNERIVFKPVQGGLPQAVRVSTPFAQTPASVQRKRRVAVRNRMAREFEGAESPIVLYASDDESDEQPVAVAKRDDRLVYQPLFPRSRESNPAEAATVFAQTPGGRFAMRTVRLPPGGRITANKHAAGTAHTFYVVAGRVTVNMRGGESFGARRGAHFMVPPGVVAVIENNEKQSVAKLNHTAIFAQ